MKTKLLLPLFVLISWTAFAQTAPAINPKYDSTLAKSFGGDEYGMKMYVLVILKTGPVTVDDKARRDSLFVGHMQNINRLVEINKMVVAGPLGKNDKSYRGIFILNVTTFEEATELLAADPAISEKMLEAELFKWYGSAALPAYLDDAGKIGKYNH